MSATVEVLDYRSEFGGQRHVDRDCFVEFSPPRFYRHDRTHAAALNHKLIDQFPVDRKNT